MPRSERRSDALSRERIVEAAIQLLDDAGTEGLTFRALTARLSTGPGAIYWHVANKGELLLAATDGIVARILEPSSTSGEAAIRAIALGVFDAVEAHPWAGPQLTLSPWPGPTMQLFERVGQLLDDLGVAEQAQFAAVSALLNYVLGAATQHAANARVVPPDVGRSEFLAVTSAAWAELDPEAFPFTRRMSRQVRDHDDRDQFLAGVDLILAGIKQS